MAHSLYCEKHNKPFDSYVIQGLPQAACLTCVHEELDAAIKHQTNKLIVATKRIKDIANANEAHIKAKTTELKREITNGNDNCRGNCSVCNDIPTFKV